MWTTLLIGGPSGSGKSTLARQLAQSEEAQVWSLDHLAAGESPEGEHLLERSETWDAEPAEILRGLRQAGLEFAPALETMVHRAQNLGAVKTVIEGERIRPDVTAQLIHQVGPTLAAFFLIEVDGELTRDGFEARSRAFAYSASSANAVSWPSIASTATGSPKRRALNLPVVLPQPWTTLLTRAKLAARGPLRLSGATSEPS